MHSALAGQILAQVGGTTAGAEGSERFKLDCASNRCRDFVNIVILQAGQYE